jgi:hypothetical protein
LISLAPDWEIVSACVNKTLQCSEDTDAAVMLGRKLWLALESTDDSAERLAVVDVLKKLIEVNPDLRVVGEDLGLSGRPWILAASRMHFPRCSSSVSAAVSGRVEVEEVCVSGPSSPVRVVAQVWTGPDSRFISAVVSNLTSTTLSDVVVYMAGFKRDVGDFAGHSSKSVRVRLALDELVKSLSIRVDFLPSIQGYQKQTLRCLKINI